MRPPYENPAQRLNVILGLLANQSPQAPVRQGLSDILGLQSDDTPELILGVAAIIELSHTIEARVANSPSLERRSRWIEPVRKALIALTQLDQPLNRVTLNITDAVRLSLEVCEELFPATVDNETISQERIAKAVQLADRILDELSAAGLEQAAHELLVRHVLALQNALKLYKVVGHSGLYDAILSTHAALLVSAGGNTKAPWYRHIRETISTLADLVQIGNGFQEMIEPN
jgi:hypothetical protein